MIIRRLEYIKQQLFFIAIVALILSTSGRVHGFLTGRGTRNEKRSIYPLGAHKTIVTQAFSSFFDVDSNITSSSPPNEDTDDSSSRKSNGKLRLTQMEMIQFIYRGDFIRDMSQFLTSPVSRRLRFNYVLDALVRMEYALPSSHHKLHAKSLKKKNRGRKVRRLDGLSWVDVGYYDSRDHVDQPLPSRNESSNQDSVFIDRTANMLNYIRSCPANSTSTGKIRQDLLKALDIWKEYLHRRRSSSSQHSSDIIDYEYLIEHKFFLLIGSTTHTMADYFAHSNFMELAIMQELMRYKKLQFTRDNMKQFHATVFPFTGVDTLSKCGGRRQMHGDFCYPVVTGLTSRNVKEARATLFSIFKTRINGVVHRDTAMAASKQKSWFHRIYYKLKRKLLRKVSNVISGDALKTGRANIPNLRSRHFTNPTHFQLNKDHSSHPLHIMAVQCAVKVVSYFAGALQTFMKQTLRDNSSTDEVDEKFKHVMGTATAIFMHPYHVIHASKIRSRRKQEFINNGMYECMWGVMDFVSAASGDDLGHDSDAERTLDLLSQQNALMMTNKLY